MRRASRAWHGAIVNAGLLARGLALLAGLAAVGLMLKLTGVTDTLDTAWIDAQVRGQGLGGETLFVAVAALVMCVGVPRQVPCFLAGYAFGFVTGTVVALIASLVACSLTFGYARLLGRRMLSVRLPARIRHVDAFLSNNTFVMALLIRLLPAGSNLLTNLAAGVSSAGALAYFAGSGLGYIPQTVIFALVGSGVQVSSASRIAVGVALFVASGVIGISLYRRHRHDRSCDEAINGAVDEARGIAPSAGGSGASAP